MEPGDSLEKRKEKQVPPVPIKTYKWEDIRREKRRGKYPYTYLFKGPYIESAMDEEKENKPSDGEKKVKKVRKVKKKIEQAPKKDDTEDIETSKDEENKKEVLMEQLFTEETEITEIKLKDQPETTEATQESAEDIVEKMDTEDILSDKTEEKLGEEIIGEVKEEKETEPTSGSDKKEEEVQVKTETKDEKLEEQKDVTDKMSVDASIGVVSKSTSEDTYTESNIEQYLDKEEPSKSASDASCLEATTSMSDVELPIDSKLSVSDAQAEKKRKHSDLSELTKSNQSLFEKMKNAKFKAPTFKIPKFRRLSFGRKSSKRVKAEPTVQKTVAKVEIQQRRKSESPVYIYIPLNPSAEELEQERLKLGNRRTNSGSSEPANGNGRIDTNGTSETEVKLVSSKWKSKPDKKSPPFKNKSGKKTSPKASPPVVKRKGDSPVEYIHIPLTGPLPPELIKRTEEMKKDIVFEKVTDKSSPKGSPKGATKKKSVIKKKDPEYKLAKDIKKLASKIKGIQKKNKAILGSKLASTKAPVTEESKTIKSSESSTKPHGDSPVQYIHIPLKGPLSDNIDTSDSKIDVTESNEKSEETVPTKQEPIEEIELEENIKDAKNASEETKSAEEIKTKEELEKSKLELEVESKSEEKKKVLEKTKSIGGLQSKKEEEILEPEAEINPKTDDEKDPERDKSFENIGFEQETENESEILSAKLESADIDVENTESKEKSETEKETIDIEYKTPRTPSSPRSVEAILRMTGGIVSDQKYIKQEKEKKESLLTRMKSLKRSDSKAKPVIKKKDVEKKPSFKRQDTVKVKEKEVSKPSVEQDIETIYPGMRHKDSIVEYIHIPLNPAEDELNQLRAQEENRETEKMDVSDITTEQRESEIEQESLTKEIDVRTTEKSTPKPKKSSEKESVEMVYPGVRHQDSVVEYIHIPLNPTEEESNQIKLEAKNKKNRETKKMEVSNIKSSETSPEIGKEKLKEADIKRSEKTSKPKSTSEKEAVPMVYPGMRHQDSIVEYIHIPLKPTEEELNKIASATDSKPEPQETIDSKTAEEPMVIKEIATLKTNDDEQKIESATDKSSTPKWKGLKVGLKVDQKSPPIKKKPAKKTSPKSEQKSVSTPQKSVPPVAIRREDSVVEYIHIPLNPTEEELAAEKEKEKLSEKSKPIAKISATRTPEPTKRYEDPAKDTSKGAVKKQTQDKSAVKDATSKLTEDIKKFALKLKELQKKPKKPTFKTFKRGSILGSKRASPPAAKKPVSSDPLRLRPRREDSPVEYIFIPLNPTPEQLRIEQERERLRQLAKKPTAEELKKEREKARPRRATKPSAATSTTVSKTTVVTKKPKPVKPVKPKIEKPKKTSSTAIDTLKKTTEISKAKLKVLKETVQQTKDKIMEKKIVETDTKPKEVSKERKPETTTKNETVPEHKFIPLKGLEVTKPDEIVSTDTITVEKHIEIANTENIDLVEQEKVQKKDDINVPETEIEKKDEPDKLTEEETHLYEPISKEDEEDGLKTAIPISKETKPSEDEQALKSVLKVADSPKLHKKVSFRRKSSTIDKDQGLKSNENIIDDNIIYETIRIGEPEVSEPETPEKPSRRKHAEHKKSVEELSKSADREEDQEKWSKSTDHEYEPINPPAEPEAAALKVQEAPPPVHATQLTDQEETRASPHPEPKLAAAADLRQLRIPLDDELIVANAETPEPDSAADRASSPDTQATYLGTPTLSSRTEGISTSQFDSAALEHVPLKKEGRKEKIAEMEQAETHGPNMQERIRTQAGKLKTKIKNIKKPTFTIPNPKFSPKFKRPKFERPIFQRPKFERPKFQRPKFETPKFSMPSMPSMPKMPDRPKINFPSFSLPRPGSMKRQRSAEERHISTTESSADSKKNIFDFRTYPRLFERSKKKASAATAEEPPPAQEFSTVPRAAARKKGPVGARWVHRFTDIQFADEETKKPASYSDELHSKDRGDSLERRMEADLRYEQALAEAEADEEMREYEKENQNISRHSPYHVDNIEYTERWRHGSFHGRDELKGRENEETTSGQRRDYGSQQSNRDEHSSVASSGHRGVIEEIDSDQFFLREKGISQDNLQVGLYLSSEIRDAFRQPVNALSQMERDYDLDASDISLTRPRRPKRKHFKKTKRAKKTPHASHEQISYDQESVNTEPEEFNRDFETIPLPRPRRTKRSKLLAKEESLETSQGELPIDDEGEMNAENLKSSEISTESIPNILGYVEKDLDISEEYNQYLNDESLMYENEVMKNIEQPEIVINANQRYEIEPRDVDKYLERTGMVGTPKPPTRRHRSLKSLNLSEHDSILGEFNKDRFMQDILDEELNVYREEHEYIIPEGQKPVPPRRVRSRSRTLSQADDDRTSHGADSLITESEEVCEPPCRQELRDSMGYAIIDKSQKNREPPLPSMPRRRRSGRANKSADRSPVDTKFFTVPRALNDAPPVRPSRNYSTLGSNRPSRKRSDRDLTAEEKENIDISQYIEIEDDDHSRDLQSGEVISKMMGRPLPAPPRPPRKSRDRSKEDALRDITQQSNIISDTISEHEKTLDISPASPMQAVEEIEVSTQTDPLPDDFCCEEFVQEPTDRVVAPTRRKRSFHRDSSIKSLERSKTSLDKDSSIPRTFERPKTPLERASSPNAMIIERKVHTPVEDETITHASLVVKPVPEYPPDSFVSKRFGADIPDILSDEMIASLISESEREDITPEIESEESTPMPARDFEVLTSETSTVLPQSVSEEPFSTTRDLSEILTETSTVTPVPLESDIFEETCEEVPEIPEKPQRRKSQAQVSSAQKQDTAPQPQIIERIIERQVPFCVTPGPDTEVEVLKAQRLQVSELDVDRLNVSELQANKILVSEIDGVSLQISELTSKSGNLVLNGLEIPSGLIQEILDRLQSTSQPPQEEPPRSTEQVSTQTSIEEPEPNNKEFTEPSTEQVATQTSIEIPDEHSQPASTEQVATQTSIEEPDDSIVPEEFTQLKSMPVVQVRLPDYQEHVEEDEEEFEELLTMPEVHAEQSHHTADSIDPQEFARLSRSVSPTIVVDPPASGIGDPEPEQPEERDAIADIRERIRFIEEEMNEFISDFTPDEMSEIKTEIESIIEIANERVKGSKEDISKESELEEPAKKTDPLIDFPAEEDVRERITDYPSEPFELFVPYSQEDIDLMPELETDFFLPQQVILPEKHSNIIVEEYIDIDTPNQSFTPIKPEPKTPKTESDSKKTDEKTKTEITTKSETQKSGDSVIPKEFYELKSEQAKIIEGIQRKFTVSEVRSSPTKDSKTETQSTQKEHTESPPRPPLPQERISEHVPPGQIFHELHYPMQYYPEYVSSVPPPGFYTLHSSRQDLSEEEVPVHHRRRRHHRHLSRSRSSSDDERRAVSRRRTARSPEPSISQLSGQLARACSSSVARVFRQVASHLGSHLGTREGKQDMKIALVILLVLIAGLILLGFGSGKTVHLHHWEYFNPPKEL